MILLAAENWILLGFFGLVVVLMLILLPIILVMYLQAKKRMRLGRAALEEGRYADAVAAFKEAALITFHWTGKGGLCEKALDGIAEAYTKAGTPVDTEPFRQLRKDQRALAKDKRYWKSNAYTKEGQAIVEQIQKKFKEMVEALPVLPGLSAAS